MDKLSADSQLHVMELCEAISADMLSFAEGSTPPQWMAKLASKGLELRRALPPSKRCCTPVGIRRATQIANQQTLSLPTLKRMKSYLSRALGQLHMQDGDVEDDSKAMQALALWGSADTKRTLDWCDAEIAKLEGKNG